MARLRDIAAQANVSEANVKPQSGGRSHNEVEAKANVKRSGTLSRRAAAGAKIRCNRNIYTLAGGMELVDVPDSKSGAARREGSSPSSGTKKIYRFAVSTG